MAVVRLYPSSIKPGSWGVAFSDAELNKVLGNTATEATYSGTQNANAGIGGTFYFDTSVVPAGAKINSVIGGVLARCNVNGYRSFYSVAAYLPAYGSSLWPGEQAITTVNTSPTILLTGANNWPQDAIRSSGIEWDFTFISKAAGYVTLYWTKAWLDIDYTPAAPVSIGPNLLFTGENF